MSQQNEDRNPAWPRTLHGFGHIEEWTPTGDSYEPRFVAIGASVGRSGQVFETDGRANLGGLVVKLFTWAAGLPAQVVQDFTREVTRVADLHHPNVAQVFDAGTLGSGIPFVVMERLAGMTLEEAAGGRSLPMADVLPILRGVGSALCAAHSAGIAHGELGADNVFIADPARNGMRCPKLLDFGVARLRAGAHQIGADTLGHRAAERSDQLALATLASRLLGSMSAPAQRVLLRAMSPDPRQRFGSVAALVEALEEAEVSAAAGGLATKAAVRTLAGAALPVSPRRLVPAVVARPRGLAAARPPKGAPTPGLESSPSSLTQQFFAEGEKLEMEHAAGQTPDAAVDPEGDEEGGLDTAAASRVPRSRAQMTVAALLALGSVAIIGWTMVSLATRPTGGPGTADSSPAGIARPVAVSTIEALRPAGTTDRVARARPIPIREHGVQPSPFAAPVRPPVTALEVPAPSRLAAAPTPTTLPAARAPSTPSGLAPLTGAAAHVEAPAPPPPAYAPATEAAPRTGDQAPLPSVAATGSSDDDEPQPGKEEPGEPHGATPAPNAPEEPTLAPAPPGDVSPAPSVPEPPSPPAPAPPTAP